MDITWDTAGNYLFFAALFICVLGLGKTYVTILVVERKIHKNKPHVDALKLRKWVQLTVVQGLIELIVGDIVITFLIILGFLTGAINHEGLSVLIVAGVTFLILVAILPLVGKNYLEGVNQLPPESGK